MPYRYETHLHTVYGSWCSHFEIEQIVEKYARLHFAGVFVTEHFFNNPSNKTPRELPWEEKMDCTLQGYYKLKEAAQGKFDVFFGMEFSYHVADFLIYGFSPEWWLAHPETMDMPIKEFLLWAREQGALVIQAHPFRDHSYIDYVRLFPLQVEGIETLNACNSDRVNRLGDHLADEYELLKTAGSDIHRMEQVKLAGMEFDTPLADEQDFVHRIKSGQGKIFTLVDEKYL